MLIYAFDNSMQRVHGVHMKPGTWLEFEILKPEPFADYYQAVE